MKKVVRPEPRQEPKHLGKSREPPEQKQPEQMVPHHYSPQEGAGHWMRLTCSPELEQEPEEAEGEEKEECYYCRLCRPEEQGGGSKR